MAAKLTRLTHKIAIQLHLVAESCTICNSLSWRPVRKLLDNRRIILCSYYSSYFFMLIVYIIVHNMQCSSYVGHLQSSWAHYYSESELCGGAVTSLVFEVPPLASDALLTTIHPLLENVFQTVDHFEISCLGAPFSWLEKPRNLMGRDLNWIVWAAWKKWIGGTPLEHPPYSPDLVPCDFWAFPTMRRELLGKKFRSDQRSAARSLEVGGAL
jgi:hypothetical protein